MRLTTVPNLRAKAIGASASLILILTIGCKREEPPRGPEFQVTSSIREIMSSMVMPSADVLWSSVSSSVTANGIEEKAPHTDQEWNDIRSRAITIIEASDLILIPARHVAPTGGVNKDPAVNLSPDQIAKLIADDPASWTRFAHAMHDSVLPALKAIDAKEPMALSDAGAGIDQACENCHLKFFYPKK
jgi:hypothetical protein